jgi:aspartokinase/homoserine dehydrogenase 1
MARARLQIWKFGGASLADAAAVRGAAELIARHRGPLVVVASALGGVTDLLLQGARAAASGEPEAGPRTAAAFLRRHRDLARALVAGPRERRALLARFDRAAREYHELATAARALRDLSARASDLMLARGEACSAALLAAVLREARRRARAVDPLAVVITDGRHGAAAPDLAATDRAARAVIGRLLRSGQLVVVPGFVGAAPDGTTVTLGRGGSDLTATLLGRALRAERVVLWKDVPGIMSADPRVVPEARLLARLFRGEAAEVAYFGAKVLHPRALIPLDGTRVALHVRSFLEPARPGTEVTARPDAEASPVRALSSVGGQAIVTVAGKGLMGVPGMAARTFDALHAASLSVSTIFQASSESSIGFTLPESEAGQAAAALTRAFREELAAGLVDAVLVTRGVAVTAVVGEGMAGTPGIAARVFGALAQDGVNVMAIAQGSSERNISFVVRADEAPVAARRIHQAFQLHKISGGRVGTPPRTDVVLLGFGSVGRALARMLSSLPRGSRLRLVGLIDRSGFVFDHDGFGRRRVAEFAAGKRAGRGLAALGTASTPAGALEHITAHAVSAPAIADVTADETTPLLLYALGQGCDLVLANKRPLAGPLREVEALRAAVKAAGRALRCEATVGAGLPVFATLDGLLAGGDRVHSVEGSVSGTLSFVLGALDAGRRFSDAVLEARALGFTEPDPREDLAGRDAARKALILARRLGYRGVPPAADDLVPPALRAVSVEAFLKRLPALDAAFRTRAEAAAARGRVLRYVIHAAPRRCSAGLVEVPRDTPLGRLGGTDNLFAFRTSRYPDTPLVVQGPGAGAERTAAGLLADLQALAGR